MTTRLAILIASLTALAGALAPPPAAAATTDTPTYTYSNSPSPVWLLLADRNPALPPRTYCWSGPVDGDGYATETCADGAPPSFKHLERAGTRPDVRFWFGRQGWHFSAHLKPMRDDCKAHPKVVRTNAKRFVIRPHATSDCTYRVSMFGRGPEGDVAVDFRWTVGDAA